MPWLQTVFLSKLLASEFIISGRFSLQREGVLQHSYFGSRNNLITFKSEAKTWLFILRGSVSLFCTDNASLSFSPMPTGTLRSSYKKITCNFSNAKILPTSFWTQWTRAWLSRLSLGIALGWRLSLSRLLLSPTPGLAPASLCVFSSSSAHTTVSALPPCTLLFFTSRLFPRDQSGSSSSL